MEAPPPLPPQQVAQLPPREAMGCFAKGCLLAVVLVALFAVVTGIGAWFLYGKAIGIFTSPQSADVRIENVSDVDLRRAEEKLNRLGQAVASNAETTIEFTAAELNAMIAREPLFAEVNNRARVGIADSTMTLEMSVPLSVAKLPGVKDRWLNGTARLGLGFANDEFVFNPKSAEANGHALPPEFLSAFVSPFNRSFNDNFRRELARNNQASTFWKHIKSIALERDKLVVVTQRL
jgi:hypothetical protein